jgi:hypothetical protein
VLFDMPGMYAAIFAAGALGYTLGRSFLLIERRYGIGPGDENAALRIVKSRASGQPFFCDCDH